MIKTNFGGSWVDYWTMILIGEHVTCKVEGYGEVSVEVQCFHHDYEIQGTCFEGIEVNEVENRKTMSPDGKVCGVLYWNVDGHVLYPAAPPIPVQAPKIILAPWIARQASQSL